MRIPRREFIKAAGAALFLPRAYDIFVPSATAAPGLTPNGKVAASAAPPGGGVTYEFQETFEGANSGYDLTGWTPGGSPDPDYTTAPAPLQGAQSWRGVAAGVAVVSTRTVTSRTEYWVYMLINVTSFTGFWYICSFRNGVTVQATMYLDATSHLALFDQVGSNLLSTVDVLSTATTYSLWFHTKTGSGANGVIDVEFATTPTQVGSGNKFAKITNSTGTLNYDTYELGNNGGQTWTSIMDKVYCASTPIGSNP